MCNKMVSNQQFKKIWIYYLKGSVNQEFNMALLGLLIRIGLMVHKADIGWIVFFS